MLSSWGFLPRSFSQWHNQIPCMFFAIVLIAIEPLAIVTKSLFSPCSRCSLCLLKWAAPMRKWEKSEKEPISGAYSTCLCHDARSSSFHHCLISHTWSTSFWNTNFQHGWFLNSAIIDDGIFRLFRLPPRARRSSKASGKIYLPHRRSDFNLSRNPDGD